MKKNYSTPEFKNYKAVDIILASKGDEYEYDDFAPHQP